VFASPKFEMKAGYESMLRNLFLCLLLIGFSVGHAAAQCSAAPSTYSTTCTELQNYLNSFQSTLNSQWNGQKSAVDFSGELLNADANRGLTAILAPQAFSEVLVELNGYAEVGTQAVTIAIGFPLLYQPFYGFQGTNPASYNQVLTFYQNVVNEAHKRGLKVIVESSVLFPNLASDLPLSAYYASLTEAQITAGRAQTAQVIAQQLQPDFINLGSEPDTQSELLGFVQEYTPQEYAAEISSIVTQLRGAGINGKPLVGAGCGTWQMDAPDYITALLGTGIDYLDFHIYAVNLGYLTDLPTYIDMAHTGGKPAAVSEAWMKKVSDAQLQGQSEYGIIQQLSSDQTQTADAFSFWAPLDAQFLTEMVDLAYWKDLLYLSPFPTQYFYSYVEYSQSTGLSSQQIQQQGLLLAATNMQNGTLSLTGQAYSTAVASPTRPVTASTASGATVVAPGSVVSVFGTSLAPSSAAAFGLPLPNTLANVNVTVTDSHGTQVAAPLFYVGPTQINAVIPSGLNPGLIALTISAPAGGVTSAVRTTSTAPGLFAAMEDGVGVAAAQAVTNQSSGAQTITDTFTCSGNPPTCSAVPFSVTNGMTALVLYGTGIRGRASISDVTVSVGKQTLPALYAGPVDDFPGLDQVNVLLPTSLAGSGSIGVTVNISGTASNVLHVAIQ